MVNILLCVSVGCCFFSFAKFIHIKIDFCKFKILYLIEMCYLNNYFETIYGQLNIHKTIRYWHKNQRK